jgi:hypothetical protein
MDSEAWETEAKKEGLSNLKLLFSSKSESIKTSLRFIL